LNLNLFLSPANSCYKKGNVEYKKRDEKKKIKNIHEKLQRQKYILLSL